MNDFNFFEAYNKAAEKELNRKFSYLLMAIFAACILVFASVTYYIFELEVLAISLEINNNEVFQNSEDTQARISLYKELNRQLDNLNTYNTMVVEYHERLMAESFITTSVLADIGKSVPEGVSLHSMSATSETLSLSGEGSSRVVIAQFQRNLVGLGYVVNVFIGSIIGEREMPSQSFSMTVRLGEEAEYAAD